MKSYDKQQRDNQKECEDAEELWINGLKRGIDGYLEKISESTQKVQAETRDNHFDQLDKVHQMCDNFFNWTQLSLSCDLDVIQEVFWTVNDDIDTSIFLVYSGKYVPATGLLRRVFENMVKAIFYESLKHEKTTNKEKQEKNNAKVAKWIEEGESLPFAKKKVGVIYQIVIGDLDSILGQVMTNTNLSINKKYSEYLLDLYSRLSQYIHFKGKGVVDLEDMPFAFFSCYNKSRFDEWYSLFLEVFNAINLLLLAKIPVLYDKYPKNRGLFMELPDIPKEQFRLLKVLLLEKQAN